MPIACLGLSFRADIDDLRESPALKIVAELSCMGFRLNVVEPNIKSIPSKLKSKYVKLVNLDYALSKSEVILVLVDHKSFKKIDLPEPKLRIP